MAQQKIERPLKLDIYDCDNTLTWAPIRQPHDMDRLKTGVPLKHDDNNILAIATLNEYLFAVFPAVIKLLGIEAGLVRQLEQTQEDGYCVTKYQLPGRKYPLIIVCRTRSFSDVKPGFKKSFIKAIVEEFKNEPVTEFAYTDDEEYILNEVREDEELKRKFTTHHVDARNMEFKILNTMPPFTEKKPIVPEEKLENLPPLAKSNEKPASEEKPENSLELTPYNRERLASFISQMSNYRDRRAADKREYKVPLLPFFNRFGFGGWAGCSRTNKLWAVDILLKELRNIESGDGVKNREDAQRACTYLRQGKDCLAIIREWELSYSLEEYLVNPQNYLTP